MNDTGLRVERPATAGFTLIEMIAVVIIVGILAAALVPMVGHTIEDSRKAKAQSDTKAIVDAIAMYKMVNGTYPPGRQNDPTYNYGNYTYYGYGVEVLNPWLVEGARKYMAKAIGNDPWGRPYNYHIYTRANPYQDVVVFSNGPNRSIESWDGDVWNRGVFNGDDIGAFFDSE